MKTFFVATLLAASLFSAAPPDPVSWKVGVAPAQVKPGAAFRVKLVAKVLDGWHLYSMKPMDGGPIPTRIWLAEGQPFQLAGKISAAEPERIQDPSFGMEVEIYEGEVEFTLPMKTVVGAPAGAQKAVVSARYQSCDNKICLPPKTVKIEVPVAVAK